MGSCPWSGAAVGLIVGGEQSTSARDVRVRAMRAGDVGAVSAIEALAFTDPWPASAFTQLLARDYARLIVAADAQDSAVGYCITLSTMDEGEIANIAAHPTWRHQGIGGRLLDEAMASAAGRGVTALFLEVRESNAAARALYASREFRQVGRRRGYYQHPTEDALVLRRDLAP